jgi:hypothetical protein
MHRASKAPARPPNEALWLDLQPFVQSESFYINLLFMDTTQYIGQPAMNQTTLRTPTTRRGLIFLSATNALLLTSIGCSGGGSGVTSSIPFPIVTWATPAPISATVPLSATQLDAVSSVPGTFVYSPAAGAVLPAGTQNISVTFTPTDTVHYQPVTQSVTLTVGAPSYTWANVQIVGGGFITGIVQHPTTQNLRYLRTDIGGAYRWNQATTSWVPLLDFLSASQDNYLGVESIALDPTNPQNLYLAVGTYTESFGGNGAFFLSNNQGATFTQVPVSFKMGSNDNGRYAGERLMVDPNLPSTLYFGSRLNGLWRSTNSGNTWSQVTSFPVTSTTSGVGIVFVDFVPGSGSSGSATPLIYVGVSDAGAAPTNFASLYRSTDGGNTWAAVPGAPTGLYVNHGVFGPDGGLYLSYGNAVGPTGVTGGALYSYALPPSTTPTGAGTWTNISVPAPVRPTGSQGGYGTIAVDPEVKGVLMAATMDDYYYSGSYSGDDIYRSTNYGATWVSLSAQGKVNNASLAPWLAFGGSTTNTGTGNWDGSLVIDPFNSKHVMYGNGQTEWDSTNITASDTGNAVTFNVGATGVEECSVLSLAAPPSGGYLISGVGDLGGFVHTSLTSTPSGGMSANPILNGENSVDFAQKSPLNVVRVGSATSAPFGAYSTTGGTTATAWTGFASTPTGSATGQGTVAIAADASVIVWDTSDGPVAYSTNNGATWTNSVGALTKSHVYSDRINPLKFYIVSGTTLQISTDGGHTFSTVNTSLPSNASLTVSFAAEGDLWIAAGSTFERSTNSGTTFTSVSGFSNITTVGFGKAATGTSYPAIYAVGTGSAGYGIYRSIDSANTWTMISNPQQLYAYIVTIVGDQQVFGRVYLATNGRGIPYGSSTY